MAAELRLWKKEIVVVIGIGTDELLGSAFTIDVNHSHLTAGKSVAKGQLS
jgi:hypothetical protein